MKTEIQILGDYVRKRLEAKNIPVTPYILLENVLCMVLAAKVSFHVPMTETPITLQSLMVVLIGIVYGVKTGMVGIVAYLLLGTLGMPVFSESASGVHYLTGNAGGFLIGFLPTVIMAGMFANYEWDRDFKRSFVALLFSQAIILACGALWMREGLGVTTPALDIIQPFLPGLVVKTLLGAIFLKMVWNILMHPDSHGEEVRH